MLLWEALGGSGRGSGRLQEALGGSGGLEETLGGSRELWEVKSYVLHCFYRGEFQKVRL